MPEYSNNDYIDDLIDDLQRYENQEMIEKARNIVLAASAGTALTGVIPIPFADAPVMVAEQIAMMLSINGIFGFDVKKDTLKALIMVVLGTGGATAVGKTLASGVLKLIPGAGSIAGAAVSGGTGGLVTLCMGNAYIEVCKNVKMGKLSLDELGRNKGKEMMKEAFMEQMKENKGK